MVLSDRICAIVIDDVDVIDVNKDIDLNPNPL